MEQIQDATTLERTLISQANERRVPINGSIELLPLCNMNCDMCYVRLTSEEMRKQGRLRTVEEWLDVAKQLQKAGVLFLTLTGGEPLIFPGFQTLYIELQKMGFILTLNTNGTLIDGAWAQFFGTHKPRRINVTLYGKDEETYERLCHYPDGFAKTIRAIRLLREENVDVKISGSLTKENQNEIENIMQIAEGLNVPVNIDNYMLPSTRERNLPYKMQSRVEPEQAARARITVLTSGMGDEGVRQYAREMLKVIERDSQCSRSREMACLAGKCSFTINWQGMLRPCVMLTKPEASVFEVGFEQAWNTIREETDKISLSEKCSKCKLRSLCRICAASALYESGAYDAEADYLCRYAEESFRLLKELA